MLCSRTIVYVLALVAMPAYAQQASTIDRDAEQRAEAVVTQYVDAINRGDGEAFAALYTRNAIDLTPYGRNTTSEQLQNEARMVHDRGLTLAAKADDVVPLPGSQTIMVTAHYTGTYSKDPATTRNVLGNILFLLEREGNDWKIRALSASRMAVP